MKTQAILLASFLILPLPALAGADGGDREPAGGATMSSNPRNASGDVRPTSASAGASGIGRANRVVPRDGTETRSR